jgi:hypothetical protein
MEQHALLQARHTLTNGTLLYDQRHRHSAGTMYLSMVGLLLAFIPLLIAVALAVSFLRGN